MEAESATAQLARDLVERARCSNRRVATAESCTGGLVAGAITDIEGSSTVLDRGFVTYSNQAKIEMIGVPRDLIERFGAVSEGVARAMAEGALRESGADIAVAITGIAGPDGGSDAKPVGLVHFAVATSVGIRHVEKRFGERLSRRQIRTLAVETALRLLIEAI